MKAWYYNKVGMHDSWYLMLYDAEVEKGKFGPEVTIKKRYMDMPRAPAPGKLTPDKSLIWRDIGKLKKHIVNDLITFDRSIAIEWIK